MQKCVYKLHLITKFSVLQVCFPPHATLLKEYFLFPRHITAKFRGQEGKDMWVKQKMERGKTWANVLSGGR